MWFFPTHYKFSPLPASTKSSKERARELDIVELLYYSRGEMPRKSLIVLLHFPAILVPIYNFLYIELGMALAGLAAAAAAPFLEKL